MDNRIMAEISKIPTKEYMDHLSFREGSKGYVYLDSLDKPTAGVGHLLTAEENKRYKVGDAVDKEVTNAWLEKDSSKAYSAALSQAKEAGISNQEMINALASVNFQLGSGWRAKMPNAWKAIKVGDFDEAIDQIQFRSGVPGTIKSNWFTQTPKRVIDFSSALKEYGDLRKFMDRDKELVQSVISE